MDRVSMYNKTRPLFHVLYIIYEVATANIIGFQMTVRVFVECSTNLPGYLQ